MLIDARIVDKNVESAGGGNARPQSFRIGDVPLNEGQSAFEGHRFAGVPIDVEDRGLHALADEGAGDCGANTVRASGYHGMTSCESACHVIYRPTNVGARRSITAACPSRASAVPESSETVRASSDRQESMLLP